MNRYQKGKEKAREQAVFWQSNFAAMEYFGIDLAFFSDLFTKLGKRYGLLREFRENGII